MRLKASGFQVRLRFMGQKIRTITEGGQTRVAKKSRAEIGSGNVYRDRSCSEILNTNTDEASYSREHRLPSCNRGRLRGLVDRGMADFVEREIVDD